MKPWRLGYWLVLNGLLVLTAATSSVSQGEFIFGVLWITFVCFGIGWIESND